MLAGGVIDGSDAAEFWRTWWLGDTSGGLVVLPLMLAWAQDPMRRLATYPHLGGRARLIAAVIALGVDRRIDRGARDLHGLPGADLGGVPIWSHRAPRCPSRSPPA